MMVKVFLLSFVFLFWFLTLFKETFFLVICKNAEAMLTMTTSRVFSFCASRAREDGDR